MSRERHHSRASLKHSPRRCCVSGCRSVAPRSTSVRNARARCQPRLVDGYRGFRGGARLDQPRYGDASLCAYLAAQELNLGRRRDGGISQRCGMDSAAQLAFVESDCGRCRCSGLCLDGNRYLGLRNRSALPRPQSKSGDELVPLAGVARQTARRVHGEYTQECDFPA
jgi:hypothetical protein